MGLQYTLLNLSLTLAVARLTIASMELAPQPEYTPRQTCAGSKSNGRNNSSKSYIRWTIVEVNAKSQMMDMTCCVIGLFVTGLSVEVAEARAYRECSLLQEQGGGGTKAFRVVKHAVIVKS